MKRFLTAVVLSVLVSSAAFAAGDILQTLGIPRTAATKEIVSSLTSGGVWYEPMRRAFVNAAPAARVALVDQTLPWIKSFVMSPEFDRLYAAAREEAKPSVPEARGTVDAELNEQEAQRAAAIAEMKKTLADAPAEYRADLEKALKQAEAEWNRTKNDPQVKAAMRQQAEGERTDENERYAQDVKQWQEEYPANGRKLVAQRLREFLETSSDVAWNAKLVRSGSKMRFADEQYESKPGEWKVCFRAGREPVEHARAFASAWLAELK